MIWDQLTSPEIDALDRRIPVILPVSATEQHGPHLPLATDRMIAEYLCQNLHDSIPENVLILPVVAIGYSEHHMDFAGTISSSHQTFIRQVSEIIDSINRHEFLNIIILNSHGGNLGAGKVLVEKLGTKYDKCQIVLVTWWKLVQEKLLSLNETGPGGVGHAGEFETSLMLRIAPELVKLDRVEEKSNRKSYTWAEGDMLRSPRASLYRSMKDMTGNGVYGDARAASAEKGQKIIDHVTTELKQIVSDLKS